MQCYLCLIDTWNPSEARDAKGFGEKRTLKFRFQKQTWNITPTEFKFIALQ